MQGSQQGQGNGLDLGEAEVAGEVRSKWADRGKEWGWEEPAGLQAPEGSLPAHRPRNSGCQSTAQLPDLTPALTLPSTNRP